MPTLERPGATLYYDTHGSSGPLFLFIPGGGGSGDVYHPIAQLLSSKYTVVTYDRRGFSKSMLKGEQEYSVRLQTDVDDAHALIKYLSHDGTAVVFGSSSGAIVSLFLLLSYPEAVRALIPHEPPALDLLPDKAKWVQFNQECYDTWKAHGAPAAFELFMSAISGGMELQMYKARLATMTEEQKNDTTSDRAKNQAYWFEHEIRQYPPVTIDVNGLAEHKEKLIPAVGEGSKEHDMFPYRPIKNLADKLGLELLMCPGEHMTYMYKPEPYAKVFFEALEKKGL